MLASLAQGELIFSLGNPENSCCGSLGGQYQQIEVVGWTDSAAETEVSIAIVDGSFGAGASITAYLMNQIGPGTTVANQIATTTFTPTTAPETDTLFTNLSLPAGTYYLVVTGNSSNNQGWAANNTSDTLEEGSTVTSAYTGVVNVIPGNSHGTPNAYAPASSFYNTTSEITEFGESILVSTAPEPTTLALVGISLFALGAFSRRRLVKSASEGCVTGE
jgi:hypothetical protein